MPQVQISDISGAIQTATTWLMRQANEIYDSENMRYDKELGSAQRRPGYTEFLTLATNKFPLGFFEAKFVNGVKLFYAYNNSGDTNTVLKCYDPVSTVTTTVKSDYPPNCKLQMVMNAGELYVAGITTDTGARQNIVNVQYDLSVSTSRNLYTAPKAAFIGENSGALYAMNVEVNGEIHPERAYISSPQRGAITYVNAAMNNTFAPIALTHMVPAMTSNTAPTGVVAASTEYDANFLAYHVFDRLGTRQPGSWFAAAATTTGWVRYDFGASNSKVISYYDITAMATDPVLPADTNNAPKNWTFEGSPDATTWTVLATVTNQTGWISGETRTFTSTNTTAYRYYRINISANNGGTELTINELKLYTGSTTREMQIKLDSARYVKVGMPIDIYKAGTDTKLYTITPTAVDKAQDTINFLPYNLTVTAVSAANNTVTVSSAATFTTGTPVYLTSTGSVPAGLTANTTYYAINDGSNDLKLALTASDASIGQAIDITGTGSGTILLNLSYIMSKTDELWLQNRHGDAYPSILWNTDYRSKQTADFIFIASGKTASTAITGWAKTNNRINIFTSTSMWQYDNANFLPVFEDIGCISHDTICNNGTWIIWLDNKGRVRARDSASGQDQIISRAIKNRWLDNLSSTNLSQASAVMYDSNYKLSVGTINSQILRFVYNFDMNVWWREVHTRRQVYSLNSDISGVRRNYFLDENGKMYLDEEGNLDATASISWMLQWGKRNFSTGADKAIQGIYVFARNIAGSNFLIRPAGKDAPWVPVGQLTDPISSITIPETAELTSKYFDFKVSGNDKGDAPIIEGLEIWLNGQQANFS